MGMRISPSRRLGRLGLVILLVAGLSVVIGGCDPDGGRADLSGGARFEGLIVETALYFPGDDHNVVKLRGTYTGGRPFEADFLGYFNATGGSERWGGPISELFEEWPGTLVQYFSNGVLSYRPSWGMEWRPAWDLLEEGAGRGGVEDMPTNANDGAVVGPGEKVVSNVSVEGVEVGFRDVYERLGGEGTFGYPKSAARSDMHPDARLSIEGPPTDVIRQYFQSAVLEGYGDATQAPMFRRLGEELRAQIYPDGEWENLTVFLRTAPLGIGESYPEAYVDYFAAEVREDQGAGGVLVGRVRHPYALSYHPQPHLLYREGDGWYAFFLDHDDGLLAYSRDGADFSSPESVTHIPVAAGLAMYEIGGELYFLYADRNFMRVFLRRAQVSGGEVRMAEPLLVMDRDVSFAAGIPNMAIDPVGRPWVVVRSYESLPTGAVVDIWVTHATDASMREWTQPVRISSDEQALRGGAGTSGSLAFVDEGLVIVFDIDAKIGTDSKVAGYQDDGQYHGEMAGYAGDYRDVENLATANAGQFKGTHDYALISDGKRAHLAYHRPAAEGQMMSYRFWTPDSSWSERLDVGVTGTHATAMTLDSEGNVWVFYGIRAEIKFRVLKKGETAFGQVRCVTRIPHLRDMGSPWLAAAAATRGRAGVMWMERPAEFWEVRFQTVVLEEQSEDADCAG